MKNYLLLLISLLPIMIYGQELKIDDETGKYTKKAVVEIDNMTQNEIYKKAIEWITLNYKSADDVIQLKDESIGKIIIKGNFSTGIFMKQGWIRHTLILDFKNNKFRYTYTDLSYFSTGSGDIAFEKRMMSKKKILAETESDIDKSMLELKDYIIKSNNSDDDW